MSDKEKPDSSMTDSTNDNLQSGCSISPGPRARGSGSPVSHTVREAYQSEEVSLLQQEQDDKFNEAMEKEKEVPMSAPSKRDVHFNPPVQQDKQSSDQSDQDVTSSDTFSRTVVVEGIIAGVDVETVELFFESSKKSGGGTLEKIEIQEKSGRAILQYKHKEHANAVLSKKQFTIKGSEVTVCPYTGLTTQVSNPYTDGQNISTASEEDIVIRVSGVTSDMSEDILELFFEHQKKSGGGQIKQMEVDTANREAFVTYVDSEVAERVLSRKTFNFQKAQLSVTKLERPKWDKKTVLVKGFSELSDETLELFYESKKKSGGGPVESVTMLENNTAALVRFINEADADVVLSKKQFTIAGGAVTVCPYTDLNTEVSNASTDGQNISTATHEDIVIRVSGVTSDMSEEILQLFFEHQQKSGGGKIKQMEVDIAKGEALLTFVDSEVAKRVLSRKNFNFQKAQLSVTKLEKPKWDKKTVLVKGFGEMGEETLELFYESKKKSGGGPVESVTMLENNTAALVRFINEADASRILQQGSVKRADGSVIIACKPTEMSTEAGASFGAALTESKPTKSVLSTSILVLGIDQNTTEDVLEMLFENESKSGGGPLEGIVIDQQSRTATVNYLQAQVAQRVLAKGSIKLQNLNLILQPHLPVAADEPYILEEMAQGGNTLREELTSTSKSGKFNCIEVNGLPRDTKKDFLMMFFESGCRSGGGEIESVTTNSENGTAVIVFKGESTVKKVLQKHSESSLEIEGCKLQIKAIDTSLYGGMIPANTSCAIQVTGLPVNASDESVALFFENRRMSGGDSLQDIVHYPVEGRAILTYVTSEVAQRVIDKHQSKPMYFEGHLLQIQMLYSNSRPSQILGPKEANVLFLQNLNEETSADDIHSYLQCVPKCKVRECVFGLKQGTGLIYFEFMPGFEKFYEHSCQKPLRGSMIDIEGVARSKSIEVYGVDKLSGQKLQLYFEHPKSKGGDVDGVDILNEEKCAIVTFVKYDVAENVVLQTNHTIERCQLIVKLHHECIGILPPHHDHTSPGAGIPSDCVVDKCDPHILAFILATPLNRKHIEDEIAAVGGHVNWPNHITENVQVQIECTLQRNMPGFITKVKTWSSDVAGMFVKILRDFIRDEVNVLQEGWNEFLEVMHQQKPLPSEDMEMTVNQDTCTVVAVGHNDSVKQFMDNVRQASANVEEKLQRQAQIITETVNSLKACQIKFLVAHKFPQNTKQTYRDMKIEADVTQKKVVFTGVPNDVTEAKLQMYELVNNIRHDKLTFSRLVCDLLRQKQTREYLFNQFQTKEAIIEWDVSDKQDGEVMVYAKTPEELAFGMAVIKSGIVEHKLDVPEENRPCLRQTSWSQLKESMLKDNEGELSFNFAEDTSSMTVTASQQIINGVLEQIKTYINENTVLDKFKNMPRGTALLLQRENSPDLRKIEQDFKDYSVKFSLSGIHGKPGYIIEGTKDGLSRALARITALAGTIIEREYKINKAGMPQYFQNDRGQGLVTSLESRYRVAIIIGDEEEQSVKGDPTPDKATLNIPVIKATATLSEGKKVLVVQGDITAYSVDAIVNAANEEMNHDGGVAKAIVDKGGIQIQQECSDFVSAEGRLLTGKVYTSSAGRLPCKKVIHTVGPKWQGGDKNEENELYESVYACLEEASGVFEFRTLALPAISSGVYDFPRDKCCEVILSAVRDYFKDNSSCNLQEIHLLDCNSSLVTSLLKAARDVLGVDKVKSADSEQDTEMFPAGHFQASGHADGSTNSSVPVCWTKVGNGVLQTQQGLHVHIVKGSIVTQQVDVIVNTTNTELNLSKGGVSSMILKAAGADLQEECHRKSPGGIKVGDIVVTSGGKMTCETIYHGAVSRYQGPESLQELRQFLTKCLICAHDASMTTIAIPAIGTGNLNYPRPEVAQVMYEEVKTFSANPMGTSLRDIYFVLYDKDMPTIQAFEAEADRLQTSVSTRQHSTLRHMIKDRDVMDSPTSGGYSHTERRPTSGEGYGQRRFAMESPTSGGKSRFERRHTSREGYGQRRSHVRSHPKSSSSVPQSEDIGQLQMDHLNVIVVKGDITKETTDAIVNSTNNQLSFASQVSRAISKAAGPTVAEECAKIGSVDNNHVAVTRAGKLQCHFIIHVQAPSKTESSRYQAKWRNRIQEILKTAVNLECRSISFPILGTGLSGGSADKMASTIFEAFHEFSKKKTYLREIRVVVFEDSMIQTFEKELNNMTKKGKGIWTALSDKFKSIVGWDSSVEGDGLIDQNSGYNAAPLQRHIPVEESILQFHIYGFSHESINQVTEQIDKACKDEFLDEVMESKKDQELIKKLTEPQIKKIFSFERSHHVKITIDKGKRVSRLRIQGQHANVLEVLNNVYRIFREIEQVELDKTEAELLSTKVQWQFLEQEKYLEYSKAINAVIEKAYMDKKPFAEFTEHGHAGGHIHVRVNFDTMKETQKGAVGGMRSETDVRRYARESVELPSSWSPMNSDERFLVVDIAAGTHDYKTVQKSFQDSFTKQGGTYDKTILKIQRVQNPSLYKKYMVHKEEMHAANPVNTVNELTLWHGTSDDTISEIHTNGFNRSFCGKNATAYGKGVYFAVHATYSHRYAKVNDAGERSMYQCKVLVGEFTAGNSDLIVPPPKDPKIPSIKFDSVVDKTAAPQMYVVFQDSQSYPEYLITYK